jgi:hypothetical protein
MSEVSNQVHRRRLHIIGNRRDCGQRHTNYSRNDFCRSNDRDNQDSSCALFDHRAPPRAGVVNQAFFQISFLETKLSEVLSLCNALKC